MSGKRSTLSCVLIGDESLLIRCAELLINSHWDVRAIVSADPQITSWAKDHSKRHLRPGRELAASLRELEFEYLFSIANLRMLGSEILDLPRIAAINFHDGPLPSYAGMYAPAWAIAKGESQFGISFHAMTAEADTGEIYSQRFFELDPHETSLTLNARCYEAASDEFSSLVDSLADGTARTTPQDLTKRSYFGRSDRPEAAGTVDWSRPAIENERLVRSMDFGHRENAFGSAKLVHRDHVVLIDKASCCDISGPDGTILEITPTALVIASGEAGALSIDSIRSVSGVPHSIPELVKKLDLRVGMRIEGPTASMRRHLSTLTKETVAKEAEWIRSLRDLRPVDLPFLTPSSSEDVDPRIEALALEIPADFRNRFSDVGAASLIAAFGAYLSRVGRRSTIDIEYFDDALGRAIGDAREYFATSVPLRLSVDLHAEVGSCVENVKISLERAASRVSYAKDIFARYPDLSKNRTRAGELGPVGLAKVENLSSTPSTLKRPLTLVVQEDGCAARILYDASRIEAETARAVRDQFTLLLEDIGRGQASSFGEASLLAASEQARILGEWNESFVEYDRSLCIGDAFLQQVDKTPDDIALVYDSESLSYRELSHRVNRLAKDLRGRGVGPDKLVGIYLGRSIEMVVAVLAVLRAGGAYIPMDPDYPTDRIRYMIEDSGLSLVLTQSRYDRELPPALDRVLLNEMEFGRDELEDSTVESGVCAENLAYVIYTSGSTGSPKGVMVEHRNVANFFAGMDERIPHDPPGSWLAVTSLSFDISVLELLWTLCRGFKVVIYVDHSRSVETASSKPATPWRPMDFGIAMWGSDAGEGSRKYELMLESARFGDAHGFASFHTPERHFGAFGGPFPNPAITSAAIAAVTSKIKIRASSCILPLHHPVRVAEEWAVVDNLSDGRAEIAFASGWQPNDFVIRPQAYASAKSEMFENADLVRRLWRGEAVDFENPMGERVPTSTLPRPVQKELNVWITAAGNVETFKMAGARGYHVLTHLLGQSLDEAAEKIQAYRDAREAAGHDPATGCATLMLHTYVGENDDQVRELVRGPMKEYLASAVSLVMGFAWTFPAFKRPGGPNSKPEDVDLSSLSEEEVDTILEFAFERYYETSGLFGTPEICADMVDRVRAAGVDEICALVDFGLPTTDVLVGLKQLDVVRAAANTPSEESIAQAEPNPERLSFTSLVQDHSITHMQCTPSMARMLAADPDTKTSLGSIQNLIIGGEAFPVALAKELDALGCNSVTNMYGPTETTIWSTTETVEGAPGTIPIGRPVANTSLYILDGADQPQPIGLPGELVIGGEGVVRGYLGRKELDAERFIPDPFGSKTDARLYRTGDLARWRSDGRVEFLGRLDHQVKIRGHRIELGEIEAKLGGLDEIRDCVVTAVNGPDGIPKLIAYYVPATEPIKPEMIRSALRKNLPEFMIPSNLVSLDRLPTTPNGKIDRDGLPAPEDCVGRMCSDMVAPDSELERTIENVWKDVLRLDSVGVDENFFDIGGHSLLIVQTHRKLREVCSQPVSLTDLYRFPTIRHLADFLGGDSQPQRATEQSRDRGHRRRQASARRKRRLTPS